MTALEGTRRATHERGSTNEEEVGQEAGEEVAVERERKRKKGGEGDADRAGEVSRGEKKREAASLWARAVDLFAEVVVILAARRIDRSTEALPLVPRRCIQINSRLKRSKKTNLKRISSQVWLLLAS